jgi:serine protease Do
MSPRSSLWVVLLLLLAPAGEARADRDPLAAARALGDAFASVTDQVGPATVYIQADKGRSLSMGLQQLVQEYALPDLQEPGWGGATSTGSGVLVSADGLVLTNHHVISGARSLAVTLWDKRTYAAEVVGSDPRTDIAVLRITGEGPFPFAPIGDSGGLRVGHWVLAIGHPFDFQFTVTAGIVSARGRRNIVEDEIQDYIQTDAAVNPGSSGGPLFNLDGEVVGINTAIFTPEGGSVQHAGISFSIPSNMAWRIAQALLADGRVARGGIGVETRDVKGTPSHPRPGAEITHVLAGSPAEQVGLRRGDLILRVNGESIGGSADLRGLVQAHGPDEPLQIAFERGRDERTVTITTAVAGALSPPERTVPGAIDWAGMRLIEATDEQLSGFGVALPEEVTGGVLVLSITPDSPAASAGLAPGDVLLRMQGEPIEDVVHLMTLVADRRAVLVHFWRGDGENLAAIGGLSR